MHSCGSCYKATASDRAEKNFQTSPNLTTLGKKHNTYLPMLLALMAYYRVGKKGLTENIFP